MTRPPLMLVTDRSAARRPLPEVVAAAAAGGVDLVQVREPDLPARDLLALVRSLLPAARQAGARVLVNDRLDVALAAGADGVHLRGVSLPVADARRLLGPRRLVGASTHEEEEVRAAFAAGADYVVFGPVFPTPSKAGRLAVRGPDRYAEVARTAPGPVLALGGVSVTNLDLFTGRPAGLAAIRALVAAADPAEAARSFREFLGEERP